MYVTVTSKCDIITTHPWPDVEVIRVQEVYVDHWKVKQAPGVVKLIITVYYWIFLWGAVLYTKFCSFLTFQFNCKNCLIYKKILLYIYNITKRWNRKKEINWPIWNQNTKICSSIKKGFTTNEMVKFWMDYS